VSLCVFSCALHSNSEDAALCLLLLLLFRASRHLYFTIASVKPYSVFLTYPVANNLACSSVYPKPLEVICLSTFIPYLGLPSRSLYLNEVVTARNFQGSSAGYGDKYIDVPVCTIASIL
jgi:hypothetical protein